MYSGSAARESKMSKVLEESVITLNLEKPEDATVVWGRFGWGCGLGGVTCGDGDEDEITERGVVVDREVGFGGMPGQGVKEKHARQGQ